jgi:large subunit ribosomal protein L10
VNRSEKAELIASLNKGFQAVNLLVVTRQSGLTVSEVSDLRRKVRAAGASYKVSKNRLTRLALEGTAFKDIGSFLTGPTAIASSTDPVAAAKAVAAFAKENEKLTIVGGSLNGQTLDAEGVKELAALPSLDELRAKLLALLQTPATRIAGVVQAPAGQLARVFGAFGSKDSSGQAA